MERFYPVSSKNLYVLWKHDIVGGKNSIARLAEQFHIEANNILAVDDRPELTMPTNA